MHPKEDHIVTLIFTHGLNRTGMRLYKRIVENASNFFQDLGIKEDDEGDYSLFNHCRVIFPNAPKQIVDGLDGQLMNSWFNYNNTFRSEEHDGNLDQLQQEADQDDLQLAVETFNELIQDELGFVLNEDPSRVFIAGFSQGASLVLA